MKERKFNQDSMTKLCDNYKDEHDDSEDDVARFDEDRNCVGKGIED